MITVSFIMECTQGNTKELLLGTMLSTIVQKVGKIVYTRKYPLRGYILGSGAPGGIFVTPKTYGATFISKLRHLELLMG